MPTPQRKKCVGGGPIDGASYKSGQLQIKIACVQRLETDSTKSPPPLRKDRFHVYEEQGDRYVYKGVD